MLHENTYHANRGGRQFSIFISEKNYTLVDLFDKAVAEGARLITVETRWEGDDETET